MFHADMQTIKPTEQTRKILKSVLILLKTPKGSGNFQALRLTSLAFQSSSIRIPRFVSLPPSLGLASLPVKSGDALLVLSLRCVKTSKA